MNHHRIRLLVVATANDDGSDVAAVTPEQVAARLAVVNTIYATAEVEFAFGAADFLRVNSTLLNRDFTLLEPPNLGADGWDHAPATDWSSHSRARSDFARGFPGRLVVIYRRRRVVEEEPAGTWKVASTGGSSSGSMAHYVNMSTSTNSQTLAHELGHYLQLPHTFAGDLVTKKEAQDQIRAWLDQGHPTSTGLQALDGDRRVVRDTPPDGGENLFKAVLGDECGPTDSIALTVSGVADPYVLKPDRSLVMSYFKHCKWPMKLSPGQARRVRDGLEQRLRNDLVSLPATTDLRLAQGGRGTAGAVTEVAVALVREGRVVTPVRTGSGRLRVIAWDVDGGAQHITRQGSGDAGAVGRIAAVGTGADQVVTAVTTASKQVKVIVWHVNGNGAVTRRGDSTLAGSYDDVAVAHLRTNMDSDRIATAVRRTGGPAQVDAWEVTVDGSVSHLATASAGSPFLPGDTANPPRLAVSTVGRSSVVVHMRSVIGRLQATLWRFLDPADPGVTTFGFERASDQHSGSALVGAIAGCGVARETAVTAIRDTTGQLALQCYATPEDGRYLELRGRAAAGAIGDVSVCRVGTNLFVTGVRDGASHLKLLLWRIGADGQVLSRLTDRGLPESFGRLSMTAVRRDQLVTTLRTKDGSLAVVAWRLTGRLVDPGGAAGPVIGVSVPAKVIAAEARRDQQAPTRTAWSDPAVCELPDGR